MTPNKTQPLLALLAALSLSIFSSFLSAQEYRQVYIFGDSLSDTGNLHALNPMFPERLTNGPVAVEYLASQLGLTISSSYHLAGSEQGNNYAISGAKTQDDDGNPLTFDINLPTQINMFMAYNNFNAPSDALYMIIIGGNDIRAARDLYIEEDHKAKKAAKRYLKQSARSVEFQIRKLISIGAKNILIATSPDAGSIPETVGISSLLLENAETKKERRKAKRLVNVTRGLTQKFNGHVSQVVMDIKEETGLNLMEFDLFEAFDEVIENSDSLGFTNNTDACIYFWLGTGQNPECNFDTFVYFDEIHPTTRVHQHMANGLYNTIMGIE